MWDLIVSVPDHCLSFYFAKRKVNIPAFPGPVGAVAVVFNDWCIIPRDKLVFSVHLLASN